MLETMESDIYNPRRQQGRAALLNSKVDKAYEKATSELRAGKEKQSVLEELTTIKAFEFLLGSPRLDEVLE